MGISAMDWLTIAVGLVSGGTAGGVSLGVMRGELRALRRELDVVRCEQQREAQECRDHLHRLLLNLAKPPK